jgi:hypothetical protein
MAEIRADKEAKLKKEQDAAQKDIEIQALQQQIQQLQEANNTGALATEMMSQFIETGLVQQTGQDEFIVHGSHGDKSFSASKKK